MKPRHFWLPLVALAAWGLWPTAGCGQGAAPAFKPELVGAEFTSREVRPGEQLAMTLKFRNGGTTPAATDLRVFVHFEAPRQDCGNIVFQDDHSPVEPATLWQPGQVIVDGPRIVVMPRGKPEQEYFVHVGLFEEGGTGRRVLDTYAAGKIKVTSAAPPADRLAPAPLGAGELAARREALAARLSTAAKATLAGDTWSFDLDRASGVWSLLDRRSGVLWASDPARPRFGEIELRRGGRSFLWRLARFDDIATSATGMRLFTRPVIDGAATGLTVTFVLEPVRDPSGLRLRYETTGEGDWRVGRVRLLQDALWTTEAEQGCVYVPYRLGIGLSAGEGLPGRQQWTTYDNLSMAMCGVVKSGAALLVNWTNVDTRLSVSASWPDLPLVAGRRMRALSLDVSGPRGECTLHPLGTGGYVEIAHAYRPLARQKGWLRTWADKRRQFPSVDRLAGATDFKPFVLSRVIPGSRFCPDGKERVHLGFTFDEVARCAEHWRRDLAIDRAYVVMAGWINQGYDVAHPDILPAAAECGGDAGLRDACERIKRCGYLVGLHDNYQDMYENAPSWSLDWINKDSRGNPKRGGNWNGGQAWQVCASKQVELAARPQTNLPRVAALFAPTIYFIDTVFAWGLVTCEDPQHPMTRQDDLRYKSQLCMLAKQHFGLFGSEEGKEWAGPCADYLEGIFGHQTDAAPGSVIPLFPLVYSDCAQIMTHQGNRINAGDEKKMADHVLFAEMPVAGFGDHLYWSGAQSRPLPVTPLAPTVTDLGGRRFRITYRWRVEDRIADDYTVFVHFTHPAATRPEGIAYQCDHAPTVPTSRWQPGTIVEDGPHTVEVPAEFDGPAQIMLGLTGREGRARLGNLQHNGLRYPVGTIHASAAGIRCEATATTAVSELWARGDGGWGESLCPTDRVIKNSWEVLSPLNSLTAETPLSSHEFVTPDRLLQRTRFGDVTITVAYERPAEIGDDRVPAYGFIVDSPTYLAVCATRYRGLEYQTPTLFTARSLDGKPIAQSSQVRVYHGFGDARIKLGERVFEVGRESTVAVK